ncbi:Cytochrome bo(3) ubiquinol oxidase subunit 3 [Candidatus Erwinia haradaeae]|uniref:Cytochrome bo(3) ubiquinol oxidase subunit 3 n=1 Tax=Candidatus Erwinia haradaeae TaxID=1922217 RepID=A0A451D0Q5_9GAMM|nr:cytochrome o ubiquinol oxidase subunit III [Candidatus Erwinia haradaeae]VFP78897.1 Cytochrome bo(3) ubiquinol oxidase subunit 3 [Candidatus Erwinia haradaeae]
MLTKTISPNHHISTNKIFGFWLYLMSDCIIFATLFATYGVMVTSTASGPTGKDIFNLPFVLLETICLLISSGTCGLVLIRMHQEKKNAVILWFGLTIIFGLSFIGMEGYELLHLITKGMGPSLSGFLSAFFTLLGAHALHVTAGLIWMILLMIQIAQRGLTTINCIRIMCLSLFWHFLDIIWICVFTIVYLIGKI